MIFSKATNSKKQGDIGLGIAISYFVSLGHTVSIPLTDSQEYDLIVDVFGKLQRIQVKTTAQQRYGNYIVSFLVKGGNRSGIGKIKKLDNTKVDAIFIVTEMGKRYLIPVDELNGHQAINLCDKYEKYVLAGYE